MTGSQRAAPAAPVGPELAAAPRDPGRVARLGLAFVAPRAALALAGDRRHVGRSGVDLMVALALVVFATDVRGLVSAAWLGWAVDVGLGVQLAVAVIARALALALATLVLGTLALWLAAGPRRQLGRAMDLACVAVLPIVVAGLVAMVAVRALDAEVSGALVWIATGVAFAWTGALLVLALPVARRVAPASPLAHPAARPIGVGLVAVVALGVAVDVVWVAHHVEFVRPMASGARAPALALPRIEAGGRLGARVELPAGKPVVIDFWATWCAPCLRALPRLDAFARRHPEVAVIAIALDDPEGARAEFDAHGYTIVLVANEHDTDKRYGVGSIPHTVLVDRDGFVREVARGGELDLEAALARSTR